MEVPKYKIERYLSLNFELKDFVETCTCQAAACDTSIARAFLVCVVRGLYLSICDLRAGPVQSQTPHTVE